MSGRARAWPPAPFDKPIRVSGDGAGVLSPRRLGRIEIAPRSRGWRFANEGLYRLSAWPEPHAFHAIDGVAEYGVKIALKIGAGQRMPDATYRVGGLTIRA